MYIDRDLQRDQYWDQYLNTEILNEFAALQECTVMFVIVM